MPASEKRPLLTRNELLAEYGFADSSERRARAQGRFIPHVKIGRKVFYRREAVEAWLAEQECAGEKRQDGGSRG